MRTSLTIILLTLLSVASHADSWCDAGNYSISWYKTTSKEFTINNEKELAGVAYLVNNGYTTFKNATIVLGNDISLNGHEWMAIGSSLTSCFQGTFDGNNHSISDVTITKNSFKEDRYMGFFSCLKNASIKNLSIQFKDFTVDTEQRKNINIGKISGYAEKCQFRNVSAKGNLSLIVGKILFYDYYHFHIGGLLGEINSNCTLYRCQNYGSVSAKIGALYDIDNYMSAYIDLGGIVGAGDFETNCISSIYGCENFASLEVISGDAEKGSPSICIGGIGGVFMSNTRLESCCNNAPYITCKCTGHSDIDARIGGIIGDDFTSAYSNGYIHNCYSSTTDLTYGVWLHSNTYLEYGGISATYTQGTNNLYIANFSPSDIKVTPYNVLNDAIPIRDGFNGDISYTNKRMKSQEFTDNLNLYYTLQGKDGKWYFDGSNFPTICETLPIKVSAIELNPTRKTVEAGDGFQITATVSPSNATDKSVTWKSSDVSIATVSQSGYVTAKKEGKAIITCTANDGSGKFATCEITVKANEIKVSAIELNPSRKTIQAGNGFQITATITPSNATDKSVTWKSSNENIATVSKSGYVTAKKEGEAIITCTANDGSGKFATCDVTVESDVVETVLYEGLNEDDATCDWTFESFDVDDDYNFIPSDKEVWKWAAYNGKHYLVGNAHEFTAPFYINSFAFSPAISVNKLRKFRISFDHAAKYQESGMFDVANVRLYYSDRNDKEDDGLLCIGDIPTIPTPGTWTFVNSGEIELEIDESKTDVSTVRICLYYHGDSEDGADAWEIRNIKMVGIGPASAIDEVIADAPEANYPTEVYNLSGVKVADSIDNLPAGIYIVRRGPSAKKIAIR